MPRGASLPYPLTRAGGLCTLLALAKLALLVPILERNGWDRDDIWCSDTSTSRRSPWVAARLMDGTIGPSCWACARAARRWPS